MSKQDYQSASIARPNSPDYSSEKSPRIIGVTLAGTGCNCSGGGTCNTLNHPASPDGEYVKIKAKIVATVEVNPPTPMA